MCGTAQEPRIGNPSVAGSSAARPTSEAIFSSRGPESSFSSFMTRSNRSATAVWLRPRAPGISIHWRGRFVHVVNLGVKVINILVVSCVAVGKPTDQAALGAVLRFAAVDRDVVIVAAAGNAGTQGCAQNPDPVPADRSDPLAWNSVQTIATPAWFSD
jgi:hypothetical protein